MRSSITSVARIDDVNLSWVVDGKEYNINMTFPVCYLPPQVYLLRELMNLHSRGVRILGPGLSPSRASLSLRNGKLRWNLQ